LREEGFNDDVTVVEVAALFTDCVKGGDVAPLKLGLPLYTAVIECEDTVRAEVENVAFPAFSVEVPNVVEPSLNVTVPAGMPLPGAMAVTVAVNVTGWL
jgi:hypothetical protein